jgi:hypothetical protein
MRKQSNIEVIRVHLNKDVYDALVAKQDMLPEGIERYLLECLEKLYNRKVHPEVREFIQQKYGDKALFTNINPSKKTRESEDISAVAASESGVLQNSQD